ncbi:hypothetical protein [Neorhodopirellula pilleata]|uniref:FHA domain-containing protein n=1 Tax=Neorhodopirellula pilleata TaxID=2714738 RepID=A0A5C6ASV6_9BACT|nr:hypothetical protein [Neorhodopirellula pilleata]TWU03085.1 hypothetical protein Pla100_00030 [Neorhodopirellula pilleata]
MMNYRALSLWFIITSLIPCAAAEPDWQRIASEATFQPPGENEWEAAKQNVSAAIGLVDTYLRQADPSGHWREYLELDQTRSAVAALRLPSPPASTPTDETDNFVETDEDDLPIEAPVDPAIDALRTTLGRSIGKHPGLERPPVIAMRQAIKVLLDIHRRLSLRSIENQFSEKRSELMELFADTSTSRDADWYRGVLPLDSWLDENSQAIDLTVAAKRHWSRPNLHARISDVALSKITERLVNETEPIRQWDEGRLITGQAVATGIARMIPVADPNSPISPAHAECRIVFDGNIHSTLNGSEGPVIFRLAGVTRLHVEQPVYLSEDAFDLQATLPSSSTDLWTDCVTTKRNGIASNLIRKIATKMIAKEHPEARADLDKESRSKFVEQFQADVADEMMEAFNDLREDVLMPLDRYDVRPDDFRFSADASQLGISMTLNGGFGLGAPFPPPPQAFDGDLGVQLHETVINRLAQRMLAGERIADFQELAKSSGFKLTPQQFDEIPRDIAIVFADDRPITARFENNVLELTVRGRRYELGRANLVAMNAVVRYRVSVRNGQLHLELDGPPEVLPPKSGKSGRFFLQRNVLAKRMEKELPKTADVEGFELPEPADRLGRANFSSVDASDGWLNIQFKGS